MKQYNNFIQFQNNYNLYWSFNLKIKEKKVMEIKRSVLEFLVKERRKES